jgi:hypothetical protein
MRLFLFVLLNATFLSVTASDNDIPLTFTEASTIFLQRLKPKLTASGKEDVASLIDDLESDATALNSKTRQGLDALEIQIEDGETKGFLRLQVTSICNCFSQKSDLDQLYWIMHSINGLQGFVDKPHSNNINPRLIPKNEEKNDILANA